MSIERQPLPRVSAAEARERSCPRCLAKPGDPCRNQYGQPIGSHAARVRAAARKKIRNPRRGSLGRVRSGNSPTPVADASPTPRRARSSQSGTASPPPPRASGTPGRASASVSARRENGRIVMNASDALGHAVGRDVHIVVRNLSSPPTLPQAPQRRKVVSARTAAVAAGEDERDPVTLKPAPCRPPKPATAVADVAQSARLPVEMIPEPLWEKSAKKTQPRSSRRLATPARCARRALILHWSATSSGPTTTNGASSD
jgi:hypothetical protein